MIDREVAIEMRRQGKTYGEISKVFGVSRQRVQQAIGKDPRARKEGTLVDRIPYQGLYDYMVAHPRLTVPAFAMIVFGNGDGATSNRMRYILTGENVAIKKKSMDKLLSVTGMTYEQLFEPREGFVK